MTKSKVPEGITRVLRVGKLEDVEVKKGMCRDICAFNSGGQGCLGILGFLRWLTLLEQKA
jgi:hypothetical protein